MKDMEESELRAQLLAEGPALADFACEGADLGGLKISKARMNDGLLCESYLEGIGLIDCSLVRVSFAHSNMRGSAFDASEVTQGDFAEVDLRGSRLTNSRFFRSTVFDETKWEEAEVVGCVFDSCTFVAAEMSRGQFISTSFVEAGFMDCATTQITFSACRFVNTPFEDADLSYCSFRGCEFIEMRFPRSNLEEVDFSGADLRDVDFAEHEAPASMSGAIYDQYTAFPAGFDPQAHGMRLVETNSKDHVAKSLGVIPNAGGGESDHEEAGETSPRDGVFYTNEAFRFLSDYAAPAAELMGGPSWPPSGYEGHEADAELAERLQSVASELSELSSIQASYHVAVVRGEFPGELDAALAHADQTLADAEALLGPIDTTRATGTTPSTSTVAAPAQPSDLPENVMFGPWMDEVNEAAKTGDKHWWQQWMSAEEHDRRVKVADFMVKHLTDVEYVMDLIDDDWWMSRYEGTSPSGSRIVLFAPRYDAD